MFINMWLLLTLLLGLCFQSGQTRSAVSFGRDSTREQSNDRPIIGVLSQELDDSIATIFPDKHSYIAASYIKYIEGAGARAVPIL